MVGRGRPKGSKNEGNYPKIPIGIAFQTSRKENAEIKIKIVNNKNIDEIMKLNYNLPGIPKNAEIKSVVMGKVLCNRLYEKYGVKRK